MCTFLNPHGSTLCDVCGTANPDGGETDAAAAVAAAAAAAAAAANAPWACEACTYLNPVVLRRCDMCGTERPGGSEHVDAQAGDGGVATWDENEPAPPQSFPAPRVSLLFPQSVTRGASVRAALGTSTASSANDHRGSANFADAGRLSGPARQAPTLTAAARADAELMLCDLFAAAGSIREPGLRRRALGLATTAASLVEGAPRKKNSGSGGARLSDAALANRGAMSEALSRAVGAALEGGSSTTEAAVALRLAEIALKTSGDDVNHAQRTLQCLAKHGVLDAAVGVVAAAVGTRGVTAAGWDGAAAATAKALKSTAAAPRAPTDALLHSAVAIVELLARSQSISAAAQSALDLPGFNPAATLKCAAAAADTLAALPAQSAPAEERAALAKLFAALREARFAAPVDGKTGSSAANVQAFTPYVARAVALRSALFEFLFKVADRDVRRRRAAALAEEMCMSAGALDIARVLLHAPRRDASRLSGYWDVSWGDDDMRRGPQPGAPSTVKLMWLGSHLLQLQPRDGCDPSSNSLLASPRPDGCDDEADAPAVNGIAAILAAENRPPSPHVKHVHRGRGLSVMSSSSDDGSAASGDDDGHDGGPPSRKRQRLTLHSALRGMARPLRLRLVCHAEDPLLQLVGASPGLPGADALAEVCNASPVQQASAGRARLLQLLRNTLAGGGGGGAAPQLPDAVTVDPLCTLGDVHTTVADILRDRLQCARAVLAKPEVVDSGSGGSLRRTSSSRADATSSTGLLGHATPFIPPMPLPGGFGFRTDAPSSLDHMMLRAIGEPSLSLRRRLISGSMTRVDGQEAMPPLAAAAPSPEARGVPWRARGASEAATGDSAAARDAGADAEGTAASASAPTTGATPTPELCRRYAKNGHCRFGTRCWYAHDDGARAVAAAVAAGGDSTAGVVPSGRDATAADAGTRAPTTPLPADADPSASSHAAHLPQLATGLKPPPPRGAASIAASPLTTVPVRIPASRGMPVPATPLFVAAAASSASSSSGGADGMHDGDADDGDAPAGRAAADDLLQTPASFAIGEDAISRRRRGRHGRRRARPADVADAPSTSGSSAGAGGDAASAIPAAAVGGGSGGYARSTLTAVANDVTADADSAAPVAAPLPPPPARPAAAAVSRSSPTLDEGVGAASAPRRYMIPPPAASSATAAPDTAAPALIPPRAALRLGGVAAEDDGGGARGSAAGGGLRMPQPRMLEHMRAMLEMVMGDGSPSNFAAAMEALHASSDAVGPFSLLRGPPPPHHRDAVVSAVGGRGRDAESDAVIALASVTVTADIPLEEQLDAALGADVSVNRARRRKRGRADTGGGRGADGDDSHDSDVARALSLVEDAGLNFADPADRIERHRGPAPPPLSLRALRRLGRSLNVRARPVAGAADTAVSRGSRWRSRRAAARQSGTSSPTPLRASMHERSLVTVDVPRGDVSRSFAAARVSMFTALQKLDTEDEPTPGVGGGSPVPPLRLSTSSPSLSGRDADGNTVSARRRLQRRAAAVGLRGLWFAFNVAHGRNTDPLIACVWGPSLFDYTVLERLALNLSDAECNPWSRERTVVWGTLGPHPGQRPPLLLKRGDFNLPGDPSEPLKVHHDLFDSGALHPHALPQPAVVLGSTLFRVRRDVRGAVTLVPSAPLPMLVRDAFVMSAIDRAAFAGLAQRRRTQVLDENAEDSAGLPVAESAQLVAVRMSAAEPSAAVTAALAQVMREPLALLAHAAAISSCASADALPSLLVALMRHPSLAPFSLRHEYFDVVGFGVLKAVRAYAARRTRRAAVARELSGGAVARRTTFDGEEADDDGAMPEDEDDESGDGVITRHMTMLKQRAVVSRRSVLESSLALLGPRPPPSALVGLGAARSTWDGSTVVASASRTPGAMQPSMLPFPFTGHGRSDAAHALQPSAALALQFSHEQGHGTGPTLEFFALVCAELQKQQTAQTRSGLWWDETGEATHTDGGSPGDSFAVPLAGLHPKPLVLGVHHDVIAGDAAATPTDGTTVARDAQASVAEAVLYATSPAQSAALRLYEHAGRVAAKAISDGRGAALDLPLSTPFLRGVVYAPPPPPRGSAAPAAGAPLDGDDAYDDACVVDTTLMDDVAAVSPSIARTIQHVTSIVVARDALGDELARAIAVMPQDTESIAAATAAATSILALASAVDDLCLSFAQPHDAEAPLVLVPHCAAPVGLPVDETASGTGADGSSDAITRARALILRASCTAPVPYYIHTRAEVPVVTLDTAHVYTVALARTLVREGVAPAALAFRRGFCAIAHGGAHLLRIFTLRELQSILGGSGGDAATEDKAWAADAITPFLVAAHGYTASSPQIAWLVDVLASFTSPQRRLFMRFTTGGARLPVGGWAALSPRLTVVRAVPPAGASVDAALPSCSTCQVYFKLPPYTSSAVLREKLVMAITEGQDSFAFD